MRIWVPLQSVVFFRNFVSSGALASLTPQHDVVISAAVPEVEKYSLPLGLHWGPPISVNAERSRLRFHIQEFVMCGLRKRCKTFELKLYRLSSRKRWLYRLVAAPWTARLLQRVSEWYLGSDPELDRHVKTIAPDWVLIPSSCEDSLTADLIKAARRAHARSLVVVNGWDNLTSKGTFPVMPDRLGLWGPQAQEDARVVHQVSDDRIVILGAPHFEHYFRNGHANPETDAAVRRLNLIPEGARVILFGGCLQPFDEVSVLRQLDKAIASGDIPNAHILYRPHPWRHNRGYEDPFVAAEFRHVSLDHQVADMFLKVKSSGNAAESKKQFPDLEYYPKVIRLAEVVISPLSTFVLESLLMGKKTIAICYSDGRHYFSADKMSQYDHVQCLQGAPGLIFCRDPKDLTAQCRQLLEPVDQADLYRRIHDHLRFVVYSDARPYADRLAQALAARS